MPVNVLFQFYGVRKKQAASATSGPTGSEPDIKFSSKAEIENRSSNWFHFNQMKYSDADWPLAQREHHVHVSHARLSGTVHKSNVMHSGRRYNVAGKGTSTNSVRAGDVTHTLLCGKLPSTRATRSGRLAGVFVTSPCHGVCERSRTRESLA